MELLAVVIISEIMYNPASKEAIPNKTEWVEVYNPSDAAVDLSGWCLEDEDGKTEPIPDGTTLAPGRALVLIPADQTVEGFRAAWGDGAIVVPINGWGKPGLTGLGNHPTEKNEILKLVRKDGSVSDTVNFDDEGDWPSDDPDGASIYLLPGKLDSEANDHGKAWARSAVGTHGAFACKIDGDFTAPDVGSPGTVAAE